MIVIFSMQNYEKIFIYARDGRKKRATRRVFLFIRYFDPLKRAIRFSIFCRMQAL